MTNLFTCFSSAKVCQGSNKDLRLLSTLFVIFCIGIGNVWGADEKFYTLTPAATGTNSSPHNAYASAATFSCTNNEHTIGWSVTGNSYMVPWRIGGKGGDNSSSTTTYTRTVFTTTAISENVTKIDITHGTSNLDALNSMTVTISTSKEGGGTVRHTFTLNSSSTPKFEANKTISLERPDAEDWSNCYYLISYNVTARGTGNQYLEFSKVEFYEAPSVAHTVTLMDNSATLTEASAGAGVTLPSRTGCSGYTFAGWTKTWVAPQSSWTTTAPTIIPAGSYTPAADENLYPVYTKTEGGGSSTITFTPGTETGSTSVTKSGVTCTMTTMDNASYYQIYANASGTFSVASGNITAISFTCTASGTSKYGPGNASADVGTYSYSGNDGSWAGSASSVSISSTAQIRMTTLSVTYSGGSTTYYISVPGCCTDPGLAYGTASVTKAYGASAFTNTLTNSHSVAVTYSSSDPTVATVNGSGQVTILKAGSTTITASSAAQTVAAVSYCSDEASYTLTVTSSTVNVNGVEVSPTTKTIVPGETFTITPTISPSNATDKTVSWSSNATDKATVTSGGVVEGKAAGTATITCTTTDGSYTATTAVTVYAVTMLALDEDGNAIAVGGPSTPSRTGASISPAADAANYVFKEWAISGASLGSSAGTKSNTITNPTGAVTVTAKYYKPRVIKWSVNGDDSYEEGSPTLKVAYNGTISDVPDAPDDDELNNCANKFVGWSTKNAGSTAKTTSYYDDLFTSASGYTTGITDATMTFYAVYAELTPSITSLAAGSYYMIDTYDDHYYALTGDVSSNAVAATDVTDAVTYDSDLGTISLNPSHSSVLSTMVYALSLNEGVYSITTSTSGCIKSSSSVSLTGCGGSNVWNQLDKDDADATRRFGFVCSGQTRTILYNSSSGFKNYGTNNRGGSGYGSGYFYLVPQNAATNYVTQCDSKLVRVNYDGNGGSAPSCSNGVATKSDSYTICSTEPTKSYYDFDGWSDGSNTYDAGDSYNLQANTTFTAQWSPTVYSITYELDGGTNDGDNPATYTIEDDDIALGEPTKYHYRFDGWYQTYSDGVFSNPITTISSGSHGDITIYAKWVAAYIITWDNPMGASVASTMVDQGAAIGDLPVPSGTCTIGGVTYSNFVGWYTGTISGIGDATSDAGTLVTSATIPMGDVTYHAVYTNKPDYSSTHTSNVQLPTSNPTNCTLMHVKVSSTDGAPTYQAVKMGKSDSKSDNSFTITIPIGTTSLVLHGVGWKDKTANVLISGADGVTITPSAKQQLTAHGNATGTIDGNSTIVFATHDTETFSISGIDAAAKQTITITQVDERIIVWGINAVVPSGSTAKYVTKCCSNLVTLDGGSPTNGSVTFSPSGPIGTCDDDAEVTMTITPASGYQLATFSVATGDGKVATKNMSADIELNNNSSSAQAIDLTFAEDASGAYNVTATFTEKSVTGWTFTNHVTSAEITSTPIVVYVDQKVQLDIAYSPEPLLSTHKTSSQYGYTRSDGDTYVKSPSPAGDKFSFTGKASTNGNTTSITLTHNDDSGPATFAKTINVEVRALPTDKFLDLIHGVVFADQSATLTTSEGVANGGVVFTYTAPGGDQEEWSSSYANTCEQKKVKLVGWVESEYADACIAADSFPTTDALKADGTHFFAVGATMTASNKTYYAVWAEIE